jgi:hypothetical protein
MNVESHYGSGLQNGEPRMFLSLLHDLLKELPRKQESYLSAKVKTQIVANEFFK